MASRVLVYGMCLFLTFTKEMKYFLLYLLLISYGISLVRPVMPYFRDAVAHVFWYSEHLTQVHYENGKYHVHLEVIHESKKTGSSQSGVPDKDKKELSEHMPAVYPVSMDRGISIQHLITYYPATLLPGFSAGNTPPPR